MHGVQYDYAVVAAQDCDLERAHEALGSDDSPLNGVLLFPASPVPEGRANAGINSKIWAHTKINANERYHVLQAATPEFDLEQKGIPDLLIDFRNYFTLSYAQLQYQLQNDGVERRAYLVPPYREHFQARAVAYISRIALDPVHQIGLADAVQEDAVAGPQSDATATPG